MIQGAFLKRPCLSLLIFITICSVAQSGYPDTTYIIQKGDNPTTISKKYHVKTKDILSINNLDPRRLIPGTEIIIPSIKENPLDTDNPIKEPDTPRTSHIQHKEDVPDDTITHRVKKGDTLSHLSRKYSIPIHELQSINNMKSTKLIIGQTLLVKQTNQKTYLVKKGDSLWRIARRFHCDLDDLVAMNDLRTDVLQPGQILLLLPQGEMENAPLRASFPPQEDIEDELNEVSESEVTPLEEKIILFARKFLDIPYRFGGTSFIGIDCSAFVQKVYGFVGIQLPRSAREQFTLGYPIEKDHLSIGDLVFFRTYASFPSHVGIYLGNNEFIHTSSKLKKVTIDNLEAPYYLKRYIGAKRLIKDNGEEKGEHNYES
jgi:cell wall-associated NlpC family hydrolase